MAGLPKNIGIVQYKNADGTKQVKYRVRVQIRGRSLNQLFDELADAKAYLTEAKSHFGRKGIDEADLAEAKALEEFKRPVFGWFFELYRDWKHKEPSPDADLLKKKQYATYKSFFKTILNTQIEVYNEADMFEAPQATELLSRLGHSANLARKTTLAKLKLHEINYKTINAYIESRLVKGVSKITVRKEISILSCFFEEARHVKTISIKSIQDLENPVKHYDKRLLAKATNKKRAKRIDEENFKNYLSCIYSENLDFAYISLLQYFGAFRMSEALMLVWENINFKTKEIHLPQTKTNPRTVSMTKDLEDLLDTIEPDKSKRTGIVVKTQTLYKYQKQIQRFRLKYDFNLTSHQFRKDAISRMIDNVGSSTDNKIILAKILGYTNVKQFANDYLEEKSSPGTLASVLENIGHTPSSINVTANNYYELPKIDQRPLPPHENKRD